MIHTQDAKAESTLARLDRSTLSVDSLLIDAFNASADALAFLYVVDAALSSEDDVANAPAFCTVLHHVRGLVERARDTAEWARKGAPHG